MVPIGVTRVTLVEQGGGTQMKSNQVKILLAVIFALAAILIGLRSRITRNPLSSPPVVDLWDVLKIEQGNPDRVSFKNGKVVDTIGYQLKYIGKMTLPSGPILLFSGQTCMECDEGVNLIVYSVASDSVTWKSAYPSATAANVDDGKVFYEGRAFFGECLPGLAASVVAFVHSNVQGDAWKDSVFTYAFKLDGTVEEKEITENLPSVEESLRAVSQSKCEELPHYDYTEE
jgi:hypothetical protein